MYYTMQHVILNVLQATDVGTISAPFITGPHALHKGFQTFMRDGGVKVTPAGTGYKPAKAGLWKGTANHSLTVVGIGEKQNEYVEREYIHRTKKKQHYAAMGMRHFTEESSKQDTSCVQVLRQAKDYYFQKQQQQQQQQG